MRISLAFTLLLVLAGGARADDAAPRAAPGVPPVKPVPLVAHSGDVTVLDFEDGRVPLASTETWGLDFFVGNRYNPGIYTWAVDESGGAKGSKRSLRLDVARGQFYFYYLSNDRKRWVESARGANRMSFYLKLPTGWGAEEGTRYQNLNIGTYLRERGSTTNQVETRNNHHYFQLYVVPDGDWLHVVVGDTPHHQRSIHGTDPAKTSWRPAIPRFYDALTRFYICGVPSEGEPLAGPYQAWFDELSFYYEDERVVAYPEFSTRAGEPGKLVYHALRVTNTHPTETRRFAYELTSTSSDDKAWTMAAVLIRDANGNGVRDEGEDFAVQQSPPLAPGESDHLLLVERVAIVASGTARRETSFLAYQVEPEVKPADPRVQNRSIRGARGDQTTPSAGCLCVTEAGARTAETSPPARIADLAARRDGPSRASLAWIAPGAQGNAGGPAFAYDVRVSVEPIATEADFDRAMPLPNPPTPGQPGSHETMTIAGLKPDLTYYFAIRVENSARLHSAVSSCDGLNPGS